MAQSIASLRILLVDQDELLVNDAAGFAHPGVEFASIHPAAMTATSSLLAGRDAIAIAVDAVGGFELMTELCRVANGPPVIAIAATGGKGKSLEHILTLAELRGAALALPKPIDAVELALAAAEIIARMMPGDQSRKLLSELEKRVA